MKDNILRLKFRSIPILKLALCSSIVSAAPPFITNDPFPTSYKGWEIYFFGVADSSRNDFESGIPGLEIDYGLLPNLQTSVTPLLGFGSQGSAYGVGDTELETKYAFITETNSTPQVAIDLIALVPSGNSDRNLGNGRMWEILSLWIGKNWKYITIYGGGGYAVNPAQGQHNYFLGGGTLEYNITDKWMIGGEIFSQGSETNDSTAYTLINLGCRYNFNKNWGFLGSIGHSVLGDKHLVGYLGVSFLT